MTNVVSAFRVSSVEPRHPARREGAKDQPSFDDVLPRLDDQRRDAMPARSAELLPGSGLARQLAEPTSAQTKIRSSMTDFVGRLDATTDAGEPAASGTAGTPSAQGFAARLEALASLRTQAEASRALTMNDPASLAAALKAGGLTATGGVGLPQPSDTNAQPLASLEAPNEEATLTAEDKGRDVLEVISKRNRSDSAEQAPVMPTQPAESEEPVDQATLRRATSGTEATSEPEQPSLASAEDTSSATHWPVDSREQMQPVPMPKAQPTTADAAVSLGARPGRDDIGAGSPAPVQTDEPTVAKSTAPQAATAQPAPSADAVRAQAQTSLQSAASASPPQPVNRGTTTESRTSEAKGSPASSQTVAPRTSDASAMTSDAPLTGSEKPMQTSAESRLDAKDDATASSPGETRSSDAMRQAPSAVTGVATQTSPLAPPATPAAAIIATVRAESSWAAYFRETQPAAAGPVRSLKIQLTPVELGNVTAHLQIRDDVVSVEITAETVEAQRQLTSDADTIAKSLRAIGLDVDRVTVQLAGRADPQGQNHAGAQQRHQGFAADGGAGGAREQGNGGRQDRERGDPAAGGAGPLLSSSGGTASGRYI